MQAWVTSNGLANSQPVPASSGPGTGHDGQNHPQQRHVYLPLPTPSVTQPSSQASQATQVSQAPPAAQATQASQNSPPRSRVPIINANSNRAAATVAARLPAPTSRTGHARDGSLNLSRTTRGIASEPSQSSRRAPPFWEGSTVDGSMFSDTASNIDAATTVITAPSNPMHRMPFRSTPYQPRGETQRPHLAIKQDTNVPEQHAPFMIGPHGVIDIVGGSLTRSASTPEARNHRVGHKGASSEPEPEPDQDSEDSPYHTSPEKSPSAKRLYHPKPLPLRGSRRGSFPERIAYPLEDTIVSPPPNQPYQDPELEEAESEHSAPLRVKTHQEHHRSTIFADTDTPMISHPDESENESVDLEPTPRPAARTKSQISRQLFRENIQRRVPLDESAMPHPFGEKHSSGSKKRRYELDYDDGALAAMDYAELKNEAFDFDPARAEAQTAIGQPRGTLPEKLSQFLDKDRATQMDFFTKMSVRDWETSGDWFLERFGEVMQRFREARQKKRSLIEGFESEIADRGEAVRGKMQGIDRTLGELRSEGEGMMLGKQFE
ncbi:extracellular mutant protein 11-domain-containing protein [Hypoxylon fragiforme]|uniref:extracellular mutant protein 11-domain-containing protein n=1 Tax=Hypoxylon fragiforme TaxID=63214 RepID=UPI0020C5FA7B|nr:extracellular mutant protein 11-domain-containing protein [Hypoxylon fragiforme]KAI2606869.1 extracellular mutant protein 11-domain-containing protein [Hypoxylon fragiforme]